MNYKSKTLRLTGILLLSFFMCATGESTTSNKDLIKNKTAKIKWSGSFSFKRKTENLIIEDQETWSTLWTNKIKGKLHWVKGKRVPTSPAPTIDFNKSRLATVFWAGAKPCKRSRIIITAISETEKDILVQYRHYQPKLHILLPGAPYSVIQLPVGKKPIRFERISDVSKL